MTRQKAHQNGLATARVSLCLEIVLASTQDRCLVCVERTIASEIILGATNGTFRDSVNLDTR
jgi:hypothetical protein